MRSPLLFRWLTRAGALVAVGLLLALAACGPAGGTGSRVTNTPTNTPPTAAPTPTPTLTPPVCGPNFKDPTYYSTLPDATFRTTTVYAQVPLPPLTRAYDDDASGGVRDRHLCSAGTTESVQTFMSDHLAQLGWTPTPPQNTIEYTGVGGYGQPQYWKNGQYVLFMGSNGSTDWVISFRDPDMISSLPFQVTSVDLAVSPDSITGTACGSSVTFTYTATFHIAVGGPGGTIQFEYTVNNGRSSTSASVGVSPGQTTATYTFTSSGKVGGAYAYPGIAEVMVTSPTAVNSPQITPSGACGAAAFQVTSVDLAVNPDSIAGTACGTQITLTYTATFHIAADGPGGTIQFSYTLNNGRGQTDTSVNVSPGQTTATYTFTSSGKVGVEYAYPQIAEVMVTSPNVVLSPPIIPSGSCGTAAAFQVTSVDMAVSPTSIAGKACGTQLTVTYTATFHIAADGPGGTIQFEYTMNNGRSSTNASIPVAAGQTSATYSFTWSGKLPPDHTYPEVGGVIVYGPNQVASPMVAPTGKCS